MSIVPDMTDSGKSRGASIEELRQPLGGEPALGVGPGPQLIDVALSREQVGQPPGGEHVGAVRWVDRRSGFGHARCDRVRPF